MTSTPSRSGQLWSRDVAGSWNVKVVSEDGNVSALGPARERYWQYGRRSTSLMVVGRKGKERTFELNGNYEPEAFSTDGGKTYYLLSEQQAAGDIATTPLHQSKSVPRAAEA